MSLGIFKKLYDMLEERCHHLDVELFSLSVEHTDQSDSPSSDHNFDQRIKEEWIHQQKVKDEINKKEEELEQIEEELPLYLLQKDLQTADTVFKDMANRAFTLRHELQELVSRPA